MLIYTLKFFTATPIQRMLVFYYSYSFKELVRIASYFNCDINISISASLFHFFQMRLIKMIYVTYKYFDLPINPKGVAQTITYLRTIVQNPFQYYKNIFYLSQLKIGKAYTKLLPYYIFKRA